MTRCYTSIALALLTFFSFSIQAQEALPKDARQLDPAMDAPHPTFRSTSPAASDRSESNTSSVSQQRSTGSYIPIGTAYNIFTILTEGQNQVFYDSDLNTVSFIHRHNDGTPGGSGGLAFDLSTDGGNTWSTNTSLSPDYNAGLYPDNTGNRYPSHVLYNPVGNTDPNEAFVVGAGPALDANSADASWGLQFRVSAKGDGSATDENYVSDGDNEYFPYGLTRTPDGSIWYVSSIRNDGPPSADSLNGSILKVWKGTFNAGTDAFDWTKVATIVPDLYTYSDAGSTNKYNTFSYNMAFSPDGNTGYIVLLGGPAAGVATGLAPKPIVYKSTDAGNSWSVLPDFDFATLSAMSGFLFPSDQGTGALLPYFTTVDLVVDNSGTMHMVSEVNSRFTDNNDPDSLYFIYLANVQPVVGIYHLTTSDGTDWTASMLDTVRTEDGAIPNPGSTDLDVNPNAQISRDSDGSHIFFTWCASDADLLGFNDLPDLHGRGYRVSDGEYTFIFNFTGGSSQDGLAYFPTIAPEVIETGSSFDYELPVVFAEPGSDALSPPQFYYAQGIGFDEDAFGLAAPLPSAGFTYDYIGYGGLVNFSNTSVLADSYIWDFGDGSALSGATNPNHNFPASDTYEVCLTANNAGGSDEFCDMVTLQSVGIEEQNLVRLVWPNPAQDMVQVQLGELSNGQPLQWELTDILGRTHLANADQILQSGETLQIDLSSLETGTFFLKITQGEQIFVQSLQVQ
jgi:hypothetical protein